VVNGLYAGLVPLIPSSAAGTTLIAVRAPDVLYADDGEVAIQSAGHATVEMESGSLVQDATVGTGTTMVGLWQNNLAGLKVIRTLNWSAAAGAVHAIEGADYAGSS